MGVINLFSTYFYFKQSVRFFNFLSRSFTNGINVDSVHGVKSTLRFIQRWFIALCSMLFNSGFSSRCLFRIASSKWGLNTIDVLSLSVSFNKGYFCKTHPKRTQQFTNVVKSDCSFTVTEIRSVSRLKRALVSEFHSSESNYSCTSRWSMSGKWCRMLLYRCIISKLKLHQKVLQRLADRTIF